MTMIGRSVLRFLLVFVLVLAALTALWTRIAPGYGWTAASIARPIFRLVESPNATSVEMRGDEIWVLRRTQEGVPAPFTWFDRYAFFAVIPLVALLCATPGLGLRRRLMRLAIGLLSLLVVHALYLVASVELAYAAIGLRTVGPLAARMLDFWQIVVRVLWEATPVVLWVLLSAGALKKTLSKIRASLRERPPLGEAERAAAKGIVR